MTRVETILAAIARWRGMCHIWTPLAQPVIARISGAPTSFARGVCPMRPLEESYLPSRLLPHFVLFRLEPVVGLRFDLTASC